MYLKWMKIILLKKCSIEKLVQEAIRTYTLMLVEKGLRLDFVCDDFIVFTDKKWFVFVFGTALDNAIKYTKKERFTYTVTIIRFLFEMKAVELKRKI